MWCRLGFSTQNRQDSGVSVWIFHMRTYSSENGVLLVKVRLYCKGVCNCMSLWKLIIWHEWKLCENGTRKVGMAYICWCVQNINALHDDSEEKEATFEFREAKSNVLSEKNSYCERNAQLQTSKCIRNTFRDLLSLSQLYNYLQNVIC